MNYDTETKLAKDFYDDCLKTLVSKSYDYAQKEDCFSNFKTIAQIVDIPGYKTFMQFIVVKIARLAELLGQGKEAKHESIEDTLKDLSNYACLLSIYLKESNGTK